jgi:protein tyrosine/serine phosphatase
MRMTISANGAEERPSTWAQPVALTGVENLHRITSTIYRCAQPDAPAMQALAGLGIKTVINLRAFHSDTAEIAGTDLKAERQRINTWDLDDAQVIRVLRLLRHPENGPFLIHCQHGADRTGTICAMYRMVEQGWSREDTLREMTQGSFGWHSMWRNLVRYLREVDVAKITAAIDAP